jgi:hypothetical protein
MEFSTIDSASVARKENASYFPTCSRGSLKKLNKIKKRKPQ